MFTLKLHMLVFKHIYGSIESKKKHIGRVFNFTFVMFSMYMCVSISICCICVDLQRPAVTSSPSVGIAGSFMVTDMVYCTQI